MPLGSFAFGTFPFGADPVPAPSSRVVLPPQGAVDFNIGSRGATQLASGALLATHPVDQEVNLALGVEQGKIASAPTAGHRLKAILKRAGGPSLVVDAQRGVREALAAPLSRDDITILAIAVDAAQVRGRVLIAVTYKNERTGAVQKTQVT